MMRNIVRLNLIGIVITILLSVLQAEANTPPKSKESPKQISQDAKSPKSREQKDKVEATKKDRKAAVAAQGSQSSGSSLQAQSTKVNVDQFSGSASLAIPIEVPAGRAGIQPNIALSYNSGNRQLGLAGVGWTLDVPFIQVSTKKGVPKYDGSDQYILNMGAQQELVSANGRDGFKLKNEGGFIDIKRVNDFWVLTDQKGMRFYFGQNDHSKVRKSDEPQKIAKWMLNRQEDLNGNYMDIIYDNIDGVAYPKEFKYTGNAKTNVAPFGSVVITYESSRHVSTSYIFGFKSEISKIVDKIIVTAGNRPWKKYKFQYDVSIDTQRDLLGAIKIEDVNDAQPPIKFSYSQIGTLDEKVFKETPISVSNNLDMISRAESIKFTDINSDGFIDFLNVPKGCENTKIEVYLNNKNNGFILDSSIDTSLLPQFRKNCITVLATYNQYDLGTRLIDINHDGYVDFIRSFKSLEGQVIKEFWINKDSKYVKYDKTFLPDGLRPFSVERQVGNLVDTISNSVGFGDLNGDGLQDIVTSEYFATVYHRLSADEGRWYSNGNLPGITNNANYSRYASLTDINGDGLADLVNLEPREEFVDINLGNRFVHAVDNYNNYTKRLAEVTEHNGVSTLADFNGDGLIDIISRFYSSGNRYISINTGDRLMPRYEWKIGYFDFNNCTALVDINGDGLTDSFTFCDNNYRAYLNPGSKVSGSSNVIKSSGPSDMLFSIDNGVGVKTEISYDASTGSEYQNQFLPFPLYVVKQLDTIVKSPNLPNQPTSIYTVKYQYKGGLWDAKEREFRGFKEVKTVDADGNYSVTEFLQGEYTKGRASAQANYDKDGKLYSKVVNQWEEQTIDEGLRSKFVYLKRSDSFVYDGNQTAKRTAQENFYEQEPQRGAVTKAVSYGEVDLVTGADIANDTLITETSYLANPSKNIYNLPRQTIVKDKAGRILRQSWLYYDNHENNEAVPTLGQVTMKKDWAGDQVNAIHPITRYSYDEYGNLKTTTDPKNNTTTITYDDTYHVFPVQVENALHQKSQTFYYGVNEEGVTNHPLNHSQLSGLWGQVKAQIDSNNQSAWQSYDGLGRVVKVYGPNSTFEYPSVENAYLYAPDYLRIITKTRVKDLNEGTIDTSSFYDGLGRLIQQKTLSHRRDEYIVNGQTLYNQRGLPIRKYIPFTAKYNLEVLDQMTVEVPFASVEYDALGRVVKNINVDGSYSSTVYDDWTVVATDSNGHRQMTEYDAYGRLKTKTEYMGADGRDGNYPATSFTAYAKTVWTYDLTGQLT